MNTNIVDKFIEAMEQEGKSLSSDITVQRAVDILEKIIYEE